MTLKRRANSTTWTDIQDLKRRSGSTWVVMQNLYRRASSTWTLIWQNITFTLPTSVSATAPKAGLGATANLTLNSTGTYSGTSSGNWVSPTSEASGLDVLVTKTSGTAVPTGTLNTWVAMSTNRTWSVFADSGQDIYAALSFQFRKTGTTAVIGTDTCTLSATGL